MVDSYGNFRKCGKKTTDLTPALGNHRANNQDVQLNQGVGGVNVFGALKLCNRGEHQVV